MPTMTLEQFRATRTESADLSRIDANVEAGTPGLVYVGALYIERQEAGFYLMLGRSEYVGELAQLEELLHGYGVTEGFCEVQS